VVRVDGRDEAIGVHSARCAAIAPRRSLGARATSISSLENGPDPIGANRLTDGADPTRRSDMSQRRPFVMIMFTKPLFNVNMMNNAGHPFSSLALLRMQ
jgi:hypothetical protein